MMKYAISCVTALAIAGGVLGCSADVKTTDDSTKVEVEGPKLEVGDQPADLDPSTDSDVDIDTPTPGDK